MNNDSPFLELAPAEAALVRVRFDGQELMLPHGANLAAALLVAGVTVFRHNPVSAAPRAPFCMMGACFDCLVEIDGVTRQACMTEVGPDLDIRRAGTGAANAAKGMSDDL